METGFIEPISCKGTNYENVVTTQWAQLEHIITEDDTPVDNIPSSKQQRLLVESLYSSWPKYVGWSELANSNIQNVGLPFVSPTYVLCLVIGIYMEYCKVLWININSDLLQIKRNNIVKYFKVIMCFLMIVFLASCSLVGGMEGIFTSGFEVMAFSQKGTNEEWWVSGVPESFFTKYNSITKNTPEFDYASVYVRVRGVKSKLGTYGHLGTYSREFKIEELIEMREIPTKCIKIHDKTTFDQCVYDEVRYGR